MLPLPIIRRAARQRVGFWIEHSVGRKGMLLLLIGARHLVIVRQRLITAYVLYLRHAVAPSIRFPFRPEFRINWLSLNCRRLPLVQLHSPSPVVEIACARFHLLRLWPCLLMTRFKIMLGHQVLSQRDLRSRMSEIRVLHRHLVPVEGALI